MKIIRFSVHNIRTKELREVYSNFEEYVEDCLWWREKEKPCEGGVCGGEREYVGPLGVWVRRKKLVRGILVFSSGPVANMNHFYCSLANMRPFIVYRPN